MSRTAFFLPASSGQRFCIFHAGQGPLRKGAVIYVPPFAEEMNKARRMARLQARNFVAAGYDVLQIDLAGCGDSSGDFSDASWESWIDDILRAHRWLRTQSDRPLWLWGLRAGCLLATEAARRLAEPANFLFWQPTVTGKTVLQQFLRMQVAGELLGGGSKGLMEGLRQQIENGELVEIAGYSLNPAVAKGLEQATLQPPTGALRLEWLEVSNRPAPTLAPISSQCIERWLQAGVSCRAQVVAGPAFWQTTEIEESQALLQASIAALDSYVP